MAVLTIRPKRQKSTTKKQEQQQQQTHYLSIVYNTKNTQSLCRKQLTFLYYLFLVWNYLAAKSTNLEANLSSVTLMFSISLTYARQWSWTFFAFRIPRVISRSVTVMYTWNEFIIWCQKQRFTTSFQFRIKPGFSYCGAHILFKINALFFYIVLGPIGNKRLTLNLPSDGYI